MTPASHPLQTHISVLRVLIGFSIAFYLPLSIAALLMFAPNPLSTATVFQFAATAPFCAVAFWLAGLISRKATKSPAAFLYAITMGRWMSAMWLGLVSFAIETFTADATVYLLGAAASVLTLALGVWPTPSKLPSPDRT